MSSVTKKDPDIWAAGSSILELVAPNSHRIICKGIESALREAQSCLRLSMPERYFSKAISRLRFWYSALCRSKKWKIEAPEEYHDLLDRCFAELANNGLTGADGEEQDLFEKRYAKIVGKTKEEVGAILATFEGTYRAPAQQVKKPFFTKAEYASLGPEQRTVTGTNTRSRVRPRKIHLPFCGDTCLIRPARSLGYRT